MEVEIHTIKRGIYGDEQNRVKGLIDTDQEQHIRIKNLEETKKQAVWFFGGMLIVIEIVWQFLKEKFL